MSPGLNSASSMSRTTRPPLDGPARDGEAEQCAGGPVVASVGPGDDLAVRGDHPRGVSAWSAVNGLPAAGDELVVKLVGAREARSSWTSAPGPRRDRPPP